MTETIPATPTTNGAGPPASTPGTFEKIEFTTDDGVGLHFRRLRPRAGTTPRGPVLMVHGAGMRWELFTAPIKRTLPDMLSEAGYDVWLLNWRASMDVPANQWTLDDAAVQDYPAALRTMQSVIRAEEGTPDSPATKVKAIVHCQGSCSFMMSICSGLLDDVDLVIANSVALHLVLPGVTWFKLPLAVKLLGGFIPYFNPQWGLRAPGFWPKVIDWVVRATHHECNNAVCKHASFTYGFGFPAMWSHENLNDETHEWLKQQFGWVPISMFRQTADSVAARELVTTGKYRDVLRPLLTAQPPITNARFVLMTGEHNRTFSRDSMARTFEFLERHFPGRNTFQQFPGYGHMDVWVGQNAHEDVFPFIVDELEKGNPEPTAGSLNRPEPPEVLKRPGIKFSEVMKGRITAGSTDPIEGYLNPFAAKTTLRAAVQVPHLRAFIADVCHRGDWSAEVRSEAIGGFFEGASHHGFRLFQRSTPKGSQPIREMRYDTEISRNGTAYRFDGRKVIEPGPPWRLWRATTRLEVRIYDNDQVVAAGMLRLSPWAFVRQVRSMRVTGPVRFPATLIHRFKFMKFFAGSLVNSFVLGARW